MVERKCKLCNGTFYNKYQSERRKYCGEICELQASANAKIGSKNPNWSGDNVGYTGIHLWVKQRLVKPQHCSQCNAPANVDLANISQEYKRDLDDWEWLCRKCHMTKDGRLKALLAQRAGRTKTVTCKQCGKKSIVALSRIANFCSEKCYTSFGRGKRVNKK